jgi:hypothetical protein
VKCTEQQAASKLKIAAIMLCVRHDRIEVITNFRPKDSGLSMQNIYVALKQHFYCHE